jgi:hypothetical protein
LHILADDAGKLGIDEALKKLDEELKQHPPLINVQAAITDQHSGMVGAQHCCPAKLFGTRINRFESAGCRELPIFRFESFFRSRVPFGAFRLRAACS